MATIPPHLVAEFDQGNARVASDLNAIVEAYRQRAAVDGPVVARVLTHNVLYESFDAPSLALLLGSAVVQLAASGGESGA